MAESSSPHSQETPQADTSQLSHPRQELLSLVGDLLQDFNPQPAALLDLPQVTIEAQGIDSACRMMKEDPRLGFKMLLCLACVDYKEYFQLVYFLHSMEREQVLVIKADVPYDSPSIPSVTPVWRAADWYEREAHDLFGVAFEGHPDLSPLVLYEGFEGYPGRKEYPFYDYQEF